MKLSVSVPGEDVEFLDAYARAHALPSRSAAVQEAVRALQRASLPDAYADAWREWDEQCEDGAWDEATRDGL